MNVIKHIERITFDLNSEDHVQSYKKFLVNKKWATGCPFDLEWPWLSVPDMIKSKLIKHYLKIN